jgi:hypothetical protein
MNLEKGIHSGNNKEIAYVSGNTYPIKDKLKALGFKWFRSKKIWWMYASNLSQDHLQKLQQLGVNISDFAEGYQQNEQGSQQNEDIEEEKLPEGYVKVQTDKSNSKPYTFTNFPVNENIFETDKTYSVDDEEYTFHITVGRVRNMKYSKTMPVYTIKIYWNGQTIANYKIQMKKRWNKSGPSYDEDAFISEIINEKIYKTLQNKEKSSLYRTLQYYKELQKREPELTEFLNKFEDFKYGLSDEEKEQFELEINQKMPARTIKIEEQGYTGEYPVQYEMLGGNIYLNTAVDHPLAPRETHLLRIEIPPQIRNLSEFNKHIDQAIAENYDKIQQTYLDYLKSFAFKEEEQEATQAQMRQIAQLIQNQVHDPNYFKRELLKRGFIRPSRRGKRSNQEGMAPSEAFSLIIDDKAIRESRFERGQASNAPDFFFTAVAYNLMRIKHNNIGFMPILLDDAYRYVAEICQRYGYEISAREIANYVDTVARNLYENLTGQQYKGWQDVYNEFYGGTSQKEQRDTVQSNQLLEEFVNYVTSLGFNADLARQSPRTAYRQLSLQLHPDVYKGDKNEAQEIFSNLNNLYNSLPEEIKRASSWYSRIKIF